MAGVRALPLVTTETSKVAVVAVGIPAVEHTGPTFNTKFTHSTNTVGLGMILPVRSTASGDDHGCKIVLLELRRT